MKRINFILVSVYALTLCIYFQPKLAIAQIAEIETKEEYIVIEGDILIPKHIYDEKGIEAIYSTNFWPNGIVPFEWDQNVSTQNRTNAINAMQEWENVANVDFRPRNNEPNFILIRDSANDADPGNSSEWVGMMGGPQRVNILDWQIRFIIVHELGHVLGLWHEQSRKDRDDYIQINWNNIQPRFRDQFVKHDAADVYPKKVYAIDGDKTYDFGSVMHYDRFAFSTQPGVLETITVLPQYQAWQNVIGQKDSLSILDRLTMSFLYPESNWYFVDKTGSGYGTGKFLDPFSDFWFGYLVAPPASVLWIQPATYSAVGTYVKPLTLKAPLGNVILGK